MCNYRQCRAYLLNAFLALETKTPEDQRLRDAIEQVLYAVTCAERDASLPPLVIGITPSEPKGPITAASARP